MGAADGGDHKRDWHAAAFGKCFGKSYGKSFGKSHGKSFGKSCGDAIGGAVGKVARPATTASRQCAKASGVAKHVGGLTATEGAMREGGQGRARRASPAESDEGSANLNCDHRALTWHEWCPRSTWNV